MRRAPLAPSLAVTVLAACGGDPKPPPTGPIAATVTHYAYTFDLPTRRAHATITATVTTAGDCFALPLRATDLGPAPLVDGQPFKRATFEAGKLTLCGEGSEVGATLTLDVDDTVALATLGPSQVGYSVTKDAAGNDFTYLVSWVGGCDQFAPCDNRPDQFATYTFTVNHPAGVTVRCPGTVTEPTATQTVCDFGFPGGPTYSTFGLAAYPAWTQQDLGTWGAAVKVTLYDRAATGVAAAIDPAYHGGFITWMESLFGPFPYGGELRLLTAPTYWNGFEHPGNIVLADTLAHQSRIGTFSHLVAHTLDHEMAHQWAGDQTTLAGTYDFVWKESMAEYLAFAYEEDHDAPAALVTAGAWKGFSSGSKYFPVPDDHPALFDYYGDVYGAGPMVLFRQLEALTSRQAVLDALKTVLGQPRALSVDTVVAALSAKTGLDLTAYAAAWIHGTGAPVWPAIQLTYTPGAAGAATGTLTVHQTNQATAGNRRCKFHVALVAADPTMVVKVPVDTFHDGVDQTISVPTPAFTVATTLLDPDHECLVFPAAFTKPPRVNPWLARP